MNKKITLVALYIFTLSASSALAAPVKGTSDQTNVIPNIERQIQQQENVQSPQQTRADDYRGSNLALPPIRTVTFNGPTILDQEDLNNIAKPYLNRPITDNDIAQLKNTIADEYTKRGYPLVKVATPTQDLKTGNLIINIFEGRVGQILTNPNNVVADHVPTGFAARLRGDIFDAKEAESVVNDLNEINNTTSSITLQPGIKPLTTDLVLNVQPGGNQDVNYIAADNYGNKLTGRYVGSLHLERTNTFGAGEKFSFDGRVSDEELFAAGGGVRVPTGLRNTFLEASYLYSHNDIVDRLEFLNAEGESHIMNIGITGNVINHDDSKLTLRSGLDAREHRSSLDDTLDTEDHIRRLYVGATYLGIWPQISTVILGDAKLSKGVAILGGSESGDAQLTRAGADPEAWMFEPSIYARHDFTPTDVITGYARGQLATHELLSSDTFILGGYGSVRGFQPAEEVGDAGFSFSAEYQHKFPLTDNLTLGVGPWFDGGHVYNRIRNQTLDNSLYSAGLGAELAADIVPVGPTKLRLDWAHPLGDYRSTQVPDNTYYFRIQQDF